MKACSMLRNQKWKKDGIQLWPRISHAQHFRRLKMVAVPRGSENPWGCNHWSTGVETPCLEKSPFYPKNLWQWPDELLPLSWFIVWLLRLKRQTTWIYLFIYALFIYLF
jgi:hypothetical protein